MHSRTPCIQRQRQRQKTPSIDTRKSQAGRRVSTAQHAWIFSSSPSSRGRSRKKISRNRLFVSVCSPSSPPDQRAHYSIHVLMPRRSLYVKGKKKKDRGPLTSIPSMPLRRCNEQNRTVQNSRDHVFILSSAPLRRLASSPSTPLHLASPTSTQSRHRPSRPAAS